MEIMYHGALKKLWILRHFLNRGICGIGILGAGMIILPLICFATEETVKKDLE